MSDEKRLQALLFAMQWLNRLLEHLSQFIGPRKYHRMHRWQVKNNGISEPEQNLSAPEQLKFKVVLSKLGAKSRRFRTYLFCNIVQIFRLVSDCSLSAKRVMCLQNLHIKSISKRLYWIIISSSISSHQFLPEFNFILCILFTDICQCTQYWASHGETNDHMHRYDDNA